MSGRFTDVINEKLNDFYQQGVPALFRRELSLGTLQPPARGNLVSVIVGVRRCGKTYRLYQAIQDLLEKGCPLDSILYFNFDDERLKPYEASVLNEVVEAYYARNPQKREQGAYLFFDEIQEVPEWGVFLRRLVDTHNVTIFVTGSSSKMLSLDLASEFRGRALSREMFPMSFSEFVRFSGYEVALDAPAKRADLSGRDVATLRHACAAYLEKGGFIAAQGLEPSDAIQLLQEYANRAINYDIIERYSIANPQAASLFLTRCLASSARELSVNKVANDFKSRGIAVGRELLGRLLSYYEEAFLVFPIKEHSRALSDNPRSSTKVYAVDPAMFGAFSPARATDGGQRLETAVFDKLRMDMPAVRQNAITRCMVGQGAGRHEIDFVVGDSMFGESPDLVQVCARLGGDATRKRELKALDAGMRYFGVGESTIVTLDEEETIEVDAGVIHVVPAWHWLLLPPKNG